MMQQWRVAGITLRCRGEYLNDGITVNKLGLQLVMGKVVLSLRSGGGDTLTRGLNEVRRKVNGKTLRNTYILMSHLTRKPVFGVSNQVIPTACAVTEIR